MSSFDWNSDPDEPADSTPPGGITLRKPDGGPFYWISRSPDGLQAYSSSEGPLGWYNAGNDTTFDRSGQIVGYGNWLSSLFGG